MTSGFLSLIVLLTTLGGFGVDANPKAPSGSEVMKYAPPDADFMVHIDFQAFVPRNYKLLKSLPNQKIIANNPEARKVIEDGLRELEMARGLAKSQTGIDITSDVHSLTAWVKVPSAGQPDFLVVVRGQFTDAVLNAAAGMGGARMTINGTAAVEGPSGMMMLAQRKNELIAGSRSLVRARLQANWRAPRIASGSPAAIMRSTLDKRPFYMNASKPSKQALRLVTNELPRDNVLADIATGHEFAAFSLTSKGMSWTVRARTQDGYRRTIQASEGVLDLIRASHLGARGLAHVAFAALHSYRGRHKEIDAVLRHEKELMKVLGEVTGDGKFKSSIKKDARKRTVTVTATGKKLSDVLPVAGVLPAMAGALFFTGGKEEVMVHPAHKDAKVERSAPARTHSRSVGAAQPGAAAAGALDVQTVWRAAKNARGM